MKLSLYMESMWCAHGRVVSEYMDGLEEELMGVVIGEDVEIEMDGIVRGWRE